MLQRLLPDFADPQNILRWIAFFVLTAIARYQLPTGQAWITITILIALHVGFSCAAETARRSEAMMADRIWLNELTNRIFYELLFNAIRAGQASKLSVDALFDHCSELASKEIAQHAGVQGRRTPPPVALDVLLRIAGTAVFYAAAIGVGAVLKPAG